ncbi:MULTISPECIES: hypothetical protein [Xanthomonas]|uniref:Integrase n=1 Tax=Xanthomonas cassavae CFBP 4642 TaxID=1219375 RepID=A0ABS8HI54_9XANT|nr:MULTISPECIES: hypothetical protein [Xanthomonas]MCC4621640.1 hypothetical protein [Xanthomonas cassavae CFBP 4642]WDI95251.1 hypothetical protein JH280_08455 [Xanthomonas campestris]
MEVKKPGRNLFVREAGSLKPAALRRSVKFDGPTLKQKSIKKAISVWLSGKDSGGDTIENDSAAPVSRSLKLE